MMLDRLDQGIPSGHVRSSDTPKVPDECSFLEEIRDNRLFEPGRAIIQQSLRDSCLLEQVTRKHRITNPGSRADRFRKRAQIDDMSSPIQPGECGKRRTVVAKVAVVIVLNDVASGLIRPTQQM